MPIRTAIELQQVLHQRIPITRSMGITVETLTDDGLALKAPLHINYNDKLTAFAGSLSAILTLSGWAMLYVLMDRLQKPARIAVFESSMTYFKPVTHDFLAVCRPPPSAAIEQLKRSLETRQRGRIAMSSKIMDNDEPAVTFNGTYAVHVIRSDTPPKSPLIPT